MAVAVLLACSLLSAFAGLAAGAPPGGDPARPPR